MTSLLRVTIREALESVLRDEIVKEVKQQLNLIPEFAETIETALAAALPGLLTGMEDEIARLIAEALEPPGS